jgi:YD repeat-containing protein
MNDLSRVVSETIYTGAPVAYPQTPSGALTTRSTYDAQDNQTSVIDPNGHATTFRYENTGWLAEARTSVTVPGQGLQTLTTSYTYDSVGNPLRVTDPNGHVSTATYDVLNRLISSTDPLGNSVSQHYDGAGRLTDRRDAKGQVTTYTYDNASRLLGVATGSELTTSYTYNDASLPVTMVDQVGSAAPATTTYAYDGFYRLAAVTNAQGLVQYGYDAASRLNQMRFGASSADLKQVWYQYDGLDRLRSVTNWQGDTLSYQYSGERLNRVRYPNGTTAKFGYDGAGQLTALTHAANGGALFGADYTLDSLGRPTRVREKQNGESRVVAYTYDELSRLTSEATRIGSTQALTSSYQYDAAGNRTQMASTYG